MKIYFLLIDHARFFFYSDESEASDDSADADDRSLQPQSGVRGWFLARYQTFRSAWQHADSSGLNWMHRLWDWLLSFPGLRTCLTKIKSWVRRSWEWLHTWAHPDEAMLSRLWSARRIDLHYPAARPVDEVRANWSGYLSQQFWRHTVWMIVNGFISPFAFLLFVLPGPNLIGYWFAYRAIHHSLAVWGIRRVQRNKIPTELYPIAALDLPVERDGDGKMGHAVLSGAASRLTEHVNWHSSSHGARVRSAPFVDGTHRDSNPANFHVEKFQDG